MKATKGFTFIELTIVIVALAILSAFAIPKYIDLRREARLSQLDGMYGALSSGTDLIHYKATIINQTGNLGSINHGDVSIVLRYGYPIGHWRDSMRYIVELDTIKYAGSTDTKCNVEWCGKGNQNPSNSGISAVSGVILGKVYPQGFSFNEQCGVYYINHLEGDKPEIVIQTEDC